MSDRASKDDWLLGAGDLAEAVVEDVPVKGKSVKVRALGAKFSNEAQTKATETRTDGQQAFVTVNKARLEILQFTNGVIEPKFTEEEAEMVSEKYAGAFFKVIDKIDEISSIDKEAIEAAQARFPGVDGAETPEAPEANGDGSAAGGGGSDVPVRVSAGDGKERP